MTVSLPAGCLLSLSPLGLIVPKRSWPILHTHLLTVIKASCAHLLSEYVPRSYSNRHCYISFSLSVEVLQLYFFGLDDVAPPPYRSE